MSLLQTLQTICLSEGLHKTYWVAYSGGLDSHVLLHLFAELRSIHPTLTLRAIHVNHSLSPNAQQWALQCGAVCDALFIDYVQETIDAQPKEGESPEDAARQGRYAIFKRLLSADDLIFTAHHQDDQAETVLLQLLRGAGPKGLSAMPASKVLGAGKLLRPLLSHSREELKRYAEPLSLDWIEDESNDNIQFSRNFIRHHVMPVLQRHWPSAAITIARSAANCAEAQCLLDELGQADLLKAQGSDPMTLSLLALQALDPRRQRQLLRLWLKDLSLPVPSVAKLRQIQQDMLSASLDKKPHFAWKGIELRRFKHYLHVMPILSGGVGQLDFLWDLCAAIEWPTVGKLAAIKGLGGLRFEDKQCLTVRFRQGGEVCRLPGRMFTHSLKKLFQEWKIPYWERDRIPLLFSGDKLIAVVGYYLAEEFMAEKDEGGYELVFTPYNK